MRRIKFVLYIIGIVVLNCCDNGTTNSDYEDNGGTTLVCLGDSLTAGYGASIPGEDDPSKSYPAFLGNRITIPVINAGVSGDTTSDALDRLDRDVLSENPRIVIIEFGGNDLFHLIPVTTTQSNLQNIITKLNPRKTKIYLAKFYTESVAEALFDSFGLTNTTIQIALIKQYDDMFAELASKNNVELINNIWTGIWGEHMSDPIHPDARGYEIMADNYFNAIKPYLKEHNLLK
jgi:acyl-CoA thioesterase-1